MFTIKLNREGKTRGYEAQGFTLIRDSKEVRHELTLHGVPGLPDFRVDITYEMPTVSDIETWESAIIENANGKTSEVVRAFLWAKVA